MTVSSDRETMNLPVLPLRDVVVFPHMVIPLFVGRDKSIRALDLAMEADKRILLVAQRSAETDDPTGKDLYETGTLAQVLQLLKLLPRPQDSPGWQMPSPHLWMSRFLSRVVRGW